MIKEIFKYTYFGCHIYQRSGPGVQFRWESYAGGQFVRADTLAGIKELIREAEGKNKLKGKS